VDGEEVVSRVGEVSLVGDASVVVVVRGGGVLLLLLLLWLSRRVDQAAEWAACWARSMAWRWRRPSRMLVGSSMVSLGDDDDGGGGGGGGDVDEETLRGSMRQPGRTRCQRTTAAAIQSKQRPRIDTRKQT
jgi:hypothetical protein